MVGEIDKSQKAYFEKHALETYKSLIQIGAELSRLCILANGGAAIALLSYLGSVASKEHTVPNMVCPMSFYALGVFVGCLYAVISWFAQFILYQEDRDIINNINSANKDGEPRQRPPHMYVVFVALFLAIIGIIFFVVGSILAVLKF